MPSGAHHKTIKNNTILRLILFFYGWGSGLQHLYALLGLFPLFVVVFLVARPPSINRPSQIERGTHRCAADQYLNTAGSCCPGGLVTNHRKSDLPGPPHLVCICCPRLCGFPLWVLLAYPRYSARTKQNSELFQLDSCRGPFSSRNPTFWRSPLASILFDITRRAPDFSLLANFDSESMPFRVGSRWIEEAHHGVPPEQRVSVPVEIRRTDVKNHRCWRATYGTWHGLVRVLPGSSAWAWSIRQ